MQRFCISLESVRGRRAPGHTATLLFTLPDDSITSTIDTLMCWQTHLRDVRCRATQQCEKTEKWYHMPRHPLQKWCKSAVRELSQTLHEGSATSNSLLRYIKVYRSRPPQRNTWVRRVASRGLRARACIKRSEAGTRRFHALAAALVFMRRVTTTQHLCVEHHQSSPTTCTRFVMVLAVLLIPFVDVQSHDCYGSMHDHIKVRQSDARRVQLV